jgi:hypothetical protein
MWGLHARAYNGLNEVKASAVWALAPALQSVQRGGVRSHSKKSTKLSTTGTENFPNGKARLLRGVRNRIMIVVVSQQGDLVS